MGETFTYVIYLLVGWTKHAYFICDTNVSCLIQTSTNMKDVRFHAVYIYRFTNIYIPCWLSSFDEIQIINIFSHKCSYYPFISMTYFTDTGDMIAWSLFQFRNSHCLKQPWHIVSAVCWWQPYALYATTIIHEEIYDIHFLQNVVKDIKNWGFRLHTYSKHTINR